MSDQFRNLLGKKPQIRLRENYIQGIEVTQSIQYFQDDSKPPHADNSIPLVYGKPAVVRVYLRNEWWHSTGETTYYPPGCPEPKFGLEPPPCAIITPAQTYTFHGTLEVSRLSQASYLPVYNPALTLNSQTTGLKDDGLEDQRGSSLNTLQFIIPSSQVHGKLRLLVTVRFPNGLLVEDGLDIDVPLRQTLKLRGIMIAYKGPDADNSKNLDLAPPTLADLQATTGFALSMFPVQSNGEYSLSTLETYNWRKALGPKADWDLLLLWLGSLNKLVDGNQPDVLYFGLLPSGTPVVKLSTGGYTGGISVQGGNLGTARSHDESALAHELGHMCGLAHAPCYDPNKTGPPADAVNPWPHDRPDPLYAKASIGGFGMEIAGIAHIHSPRSTSDFMSYCEALWISLTNYQNLLRNPKLHPELIDTWTPPDLIPRPPLIPKPYPIRVISFIGLIHSENEVEVKNVIRLKTYTHIGSAQKTDLVAELIGKDGNVTSRGPVFALNTSFHVQGCGCTGCAPNEYPRIFQAFIPDTERGISLRIRRAEKELWNHRAATTKMRITNWQARVVTERKQVRISIDWAVDSPENESVEAHIRWSSDGGKNWRALVSGVRERTTKIDAAYLPAGSVQLQLMVSDGFDTVESTSSRLEIPGRDPVITVYSPTNVDPMLEGSLIRFRAAATGDDFQTVKSENAEWFMKGKSLGKGLDIFSVAPPRGQHVVTLVISVRGRKVKRDIAFKTVRLSKGA